MPWNVKEWSLKLTKIMEEVAFYLQWVELHSLPGNDGSALITETVV